MDGYLILVKTTKLAATLNRGIRFLFFSFFIFSCERNKDEKLYKINENSLQVRQMAIDSIKSWRDNSLGLYNYLKNKKWYIDSTIAFNNDSSRIICAFMSNNNDDIKATSDAICYFYGEKINGNWCFFRGAGIVIPREMVKDQPINEPLSYQQLHQIALKEVYGGYLNKDGEINEAWFISQFEGAGWGKYPETLEDVKKLTRTDYEKRHLDKVRNNWYGAKKDGVKQLQNKNEVLP